MDTIKHLVHANSNSIINGKPKQPADTRIRYGELAVNYKKGSETIFKDHFEDGNIVGDFSFKYPELSVEDY